MEILIPGNGTIDIKNILLDYNGTVAIDGKLIPGVEAVLNELSNHFYIHIITADTFGTSRSELKNVKCTLTILDPGNQSEAKLQYLLDLGKEQTASIGNGRNDMLILKESALGVALVQMEGVYTQTLFHSDIVCPDIMSALDLFRKPKRLVATMRD